MLLPLLMNNLLGGGGVINTTGTCIGSAELVCEISATNTAPVVGTPYNVPAAVGPLREYWLRETANGIPEGPYSYYEAETKARTATREAARTGLGPVVLELITYLGTRQGDPPFNPILTKVIYIYLAGRKVTGGLLAQYNSARGKT